MGLKLNEREIVRPVALCRSDGTLNPAAVGFTRSPLHDTSGIGHGARHWGRNKRWEYWAVTSPTHIVSITVSSLDYASVHGFWVHDRRTGKTTDFGRVGAPWTAELPVSVGKGPASARMRGLHIELTETPEGTRLQASAKNAIVDIVARRPEGHESLGVVVPWSSRRFQYTVKDVARPAEGTVTLGGVRTRIGEDAWATLDHGRGRWPYRSHWNWAAASGRTDGRTIGLQLGARWTDGTGSTENAFVVNGRLHKVSEELDWEYDLARPTSPWRITGEAAELEMTPFYDHVTRTELGIIGTRGYQAFGTYRGWVQAGQERVEVDGIVGWAEDVANRW